MTIIVKSLPTLRVADIGYDFKDTEFLTICTF